MNRTAIVCTVAICGMILLSAVGYVVYDQFQKNEAERQRNAEIADKIARGINAAGAESSARTEELRRETELERERFEREKAKLLGTQPADNP